MNSQTPTPGRTEWTVYATLMLIGVFVGAFSETLQVPQSLNEYLRSFQKPEAVISEGIPPAVSTPPISRLRVRPAWTFLSEIGERL